MGANDFQCTCGHRCKRCAGERGLVALIQKCHFSGRLKPHFAEISSRFRASTTSTTPGGCWASRFAAFFTTSSKVRQTADMPPALPPRGERLLSDGLQGTCGVESFVRMNQLREHRSSYEIHRLRCHRAMRSVLAVRSTTW